MTQSYCWPNNASIIGIHNNVWMYFRADTGLNDKWPGLSPADHDITGARHCGCSMHMPSISQRSLQNRNKQPQQVAFILWAITNFADPGDCHGDGINIPKNRIDLKWQREMWGKDCPKFCAVHQRAPRQQMWGLIASAHISSASLTMYKLSRSSSPQYSLTPSSTPVHTNVCRQVHQLVLAHKGMFLHYIRARMRTNTHTFTIQTIQTHTHTHMHTHTHTHTHTHPHNHIKIHTQKHRSGFT